VAEGKESSRLVRHVTNKEEPQPQQTQSYHSLTTVEEHSGGTLPTNVVLYASGLPKEDRVLAKIARILATSYDISPKYVFGTTDPSEVHIRGLGTPANMKDLQRLTDNFSPIAIAGMLGSVVQAVTAQDAASKTLALTGPAVRAGVSLPTNIKGEAPDARRVGQFASVLSQLMDGIDIKQGLGMAVALSQQNVNPKAFYHNYAAVKEWWGSSTDTPFDSQRAVGLALQLGNKQPQSTAELERALFGKKQVDAQARITQELQKTRSQLTYYNYDTGQMVYPTNEETAILTQRYVDTYQEGIQVAISGQLSPDFWQQAQDVQEQIRLENEAMGHTPLGRVLNFVGFLGSKSWEATEKGLANLGGDIMSGVQPIANLAAGKGISGAYNGYTFWQQKKTEAVSRINMGDSVGDFVEEGYGRGYGGLGLALPSWTSTAFDFGVGWYVDPLVFVGKVARVARGVDPILGGRAALLDDAGNVIREATGPSVFGKELPFLTVPGRVVPHLDESFKLTENVVSLLPGGKSLVVGRRMSIDAALQAGFSRYVTDVLPNSRVANKLWESLKSGWTAYSRDLDLRTPGTFVGRTLDYQYMKLVRDRIMLKYGDGGIISPALEAEARAAFGEALKAHFVGWGPEGSVAEWAVTQRTGLARDALKNALESGSETIPKDLQQAMGDYLAAGGEGVGYHIPMTQEGPKLLGLYGPRRLYREAASSDFLTSTPLGRKAGSLNNVNPGRVVDVNHADEYFVLHARRWATFDERAVRRFQGEVLEARSKGFWKFTEPDGSTISMGYERGLARRLEELNDEAIDTILAPYGVSDDLAQEIKDAIFSPTRAQNQKTRTFLAREDRGPDVVTITGEPGNLVKTTEPALETQLRNQIYTVDPVEARRVVHDWISAPERAKRALLKHIGKEAPELSERVARSFASKAGKETIDLLKNLNHGRVKLWKALTVARPGYIPRVILGDENARYLVTTRSVSERIIAQEWWGLTKKLDKKGVFNSQIDTVLRYADGSEVKLAAIGAYERNARAVGSIRRSEQIEDMMRSGTLDFSTLSATGSWKPVAAAAREGLPEGVEIIGRNKFLTNWRWVLEKQWGKSRPGQVALESVAAGETVAQTRAALIKWAKEDHFVVLRARLGYKPQEWDNWFDEVSMSAHAYTLGDPDIARSALANAGDDLKAVLGKYRNDQMPVVHGPSTEDLLNGRSAASGSNLTNKMYQHLVSGPEARMNRHPYFKTWKRHAEGAYYKHMATNGITDISPELRNAVDAASTEFALDQVRRVMFDLTRQSRFTELLQFAFPFPQPFFEGFQTWGAIAMRNPEGIGRIMQLYRTGVESGFIRKDPQTGEMVIPMHGMKWFAAPWMALHGKSMKDLDKLGLGFVAPLTSFNMLASSSIKFGATTPIIGRFIGGVPIPAPGMDPLFSLAGQYILSDTKSVPITSYLFQYGPQSPTSLLPNMVKVALGIIPEEQEKALTYSVLRAYQVQGLHKDLTQEELLATAQNDAHELLMVRQFSQLFSPGALRTQTAASPYEGEWSALLETSDSYETAIDTWMKKHPDLSYIPIGKTMFSGGQIKDPVTGAYVQTPRVPTSEFFGTLFNSPGIGEFLHTRQGMAFAGLFLIGLDPSITEAQDFPTYSKFLREGIIQYKPYDQFLAAGENLKVRHEIDLFYAETWDPLMDKILDGKTAPDYTSAAYKNLIVLRQEKLSELAHANPLWASQNLRLQETPFADGTPRYDWPTDSGPDRPYSLAIDQARQAAEAPEVRNSPGFRALHDVIAVYDKVKEKMHKSGYTDIFQTSAVEDGLPDQLANGLTKIYKQTPEIEQYVESAFGIRLTDGTLEYASPLASLPAAWRENVAGLPAGMRNAVEKFDTHYKNLSPSKQNWEFDWQRNQFYQAQSNFSDDKYLKNPKVMQAWWDDYMAGQHDTYRANLVTSPPVFYSAWDWHVLGKDLSKDTIDTMKWIGDARITIQKSEWRDPEGFSEGDAYKKLNAQVRGFMRDNDELKNIVNIVNDPSWVLRQFNDQYVNAPGQAGEAWKAIAKGASEMADYNAKYGLTGTGDYDKGQANWYVTLQRSFTKYVDKWKETSPAFASQWLELRNALGGDPVANMLIPDTFFPLGGEA